MEASILWSEITRLATYWASKLPATYADPSSSILIDDDRGAESFLEVEVDAFRHHRCPRPGSDGYQLRVTPSRSFPRDIPRAPDAIG